LNRDRYEGPGKKMDTKTILAAIEVGMFDSALMDKYKLSAAGLEGLAS
jgi:hypothetical protein